MPTLPNPFDLVRSNDAPSLPDAWSRVVVYTVKPSVDCGRYPIKRTPGQPVEVTAGVIADGHETLGVELVYGRFGSDEEQATRMRLSNNDWYHATFAPEELGRWHYRVRAWIDRYATWQGLFQRRVEGGSPQQELLVELQEGANLLDASAAVADERGSAAAGALHDYAERFRDGDVDAAMDPATVSLAQQYDPKKGATESDVYPLLCDPEIARFAAWYEFFPRSARSDDRHATLDDAAELLPRIKELGFDVVYLPPIHPIGEKFRKGRDNAPTAQPGDVGSPWAIGGKKADGELGGHKAVHPELGGEEAFERFVAKAQELGLEVALDIAYQCSPDHPYVRDHPSWFQQRADGTIRYAENPPKKYQDVHPIDFESEDWEALWEELKSVFEHWIDRGVTVFRVDNPHTKPFSFWAWCLEALRREHPEVVVLAEAFTKPKTMHQLAKLGYNNSYTYFTWRNTKEELEEYAEQLFLTDDAEYFRPNFWPNTPDILHDFLVEGGRPAHVLRFVLAATMSSAYGIYGPPYEHVDNRQHPKREEYAQNEKYELRHWNWHDPDSLQPLMQALNKARRENPALQYMRPFALHETTSDHLLAYSKSREGNHILVVANVDPHNAHEGLVHLDLDALDLADGEPFIAHDLLTGARYPWQGASNYVRLDPHELPVHVFRVER